MHMVQNAPKYKYKNYQKLLKIKAFITDLRVHTTSYLGIIRNDQIMHTCSEQPIVLVSTLNKYIIIVFFYTGLTYRRFVLNLFKRIY